MRRGIVVEQVGCGDADQRQHDVVAQVSEVEQGDPPEQAKDQHNRGGQQHVPGRQA
jgi:hypothetical protein